MTVHQLFPEQPGTSAPRVGSILPPEFSSTSAPKMPAGCPVVAKASDTPDLRDVHKRVESYRTSKWPLTQAMKDAIALDDELTAVRTVAWLKLQLEEPS